MIVPSSRLVFWTAMIMPAFGLAASTIPGAAGISFGFIGLFSFLAFVDALLTGRALGGLSLEFPPLFRMAKGRTGAIELIARNSTKKVRRLKLALGFPREITAQDDVISLELPAEDHAMRFLVPCTPARRGTYSIRQCFLETRSLLGLWVKRGVMPAEFEVRVYPDLSPERKNLSALFLRRGDFGVRSRRQVGQGRDFEKLRDYIPGDGYDQIHWKASAKRGHPVTKEYQIERTQEVYVVIDASRLSGRLSGQPAGPGDAAPSPEPDLERYISAALVLGIAAERYGDRFGLITFSDRVKGFVRANRGKHHYHSCREALYLLQSETVTPDFEELSAFIGTKLRRRSLFIFLTSLDDPLLAENFLQSIGPVSRRHLVLVAMMKPEGTGPLFSGPEVTTRDDIYSRLGGHMLWHDLLELEKTLYHRGIAFSLLSNEKACNQLVSHYVSLRQRQLL